MTHDTTANKSKELVIQLEDESVLSTRGRIKKIIELEEDMPAITRQITTEHQRQDVKQKEPLRSDPLRHTEADAKTINCK